MGMRLFPSIDCSYEKGATLDLYLTLDIALGYSYNSYMYNNIMHVLL